MSAICGGVMSMSMLMKGIKKYGAYYGMMEFTLPDKQYARYVKYHKEGKLKQAQKVFDRYASSGI